MISTPNEAEKAWKHHQSQRDPSIGLTALQHQARAAEIDAYRRGPRVEVALWLTGVLPGANALRVGIDYDKWFASCSYRKPAATVLLVGKLSDYRRRGLFGYQEPYSARLAAGLTEDPGSPRLLALTRGDNVRVAGFREFRDPDYVDGENSARPTVLLSAAILL